MSAVLAANLVEVLATLSSGGFALLLFQNMVMAKVLAMRKRYPLLADDIEFLEYEHGWYFFTAWLGACASFALMFALIFQEIYESMDMIDSATTVLSLLVVYLIMMMFWLTVQYIVGKRKNAGNTYAYVFIFLAIACAVVVTVLVFATLHENPWYHYLVLFLYVGPVFAVFATNSAATYRELRSGVDQYKPTSPVFNSQPLSNGTPPLVFLSATGNGPAGYDGQN